MVDALSEELGAYYLFHSARGELLRRMERFALAREAYEAALARCENETERRFLRGRIHTLGGAHVS